MSRSSISAADPYLRRRTRVLDTEMAYVDAGRGDIARRPIGLAQAAPCPVASDGTADLAADREARAPRAGGRRGWWHRGPCNKLLG